MYRFLVSAVMLLSLLTGCAEPTPPNIQVVAGDHLQVQVIRVAYEWRERFGMAVQRDGPVRPGEMGLYGVSPTSIPRGTVVRVRFDQPPLAGSVQAEVWQDGKLQPVSVGQDQTLILPQKPGIYTYRISSRWPQGYAEYSFQVEVKA